MNTNITVLKSAIFGILALVAASAHAEIDPTVDDCVGLTSCGVVEGSISNQGTTESTVFSDNEWEGVPY